MINLNVSRTFFNSWNALAEYLPNNPISPHATNNASIVAQKDSLDEDRCA